MTQPVRFISGRSSQAGLSLSSSHGTRRRILSIFALLPLLPVLASRKSLARGYAVAGDHATCVQGHRIATLTRSVVPGDHLSLNVFSDWRIPVPKTLNPAPLCPICNRVWFLGQSLTGFPAVHVEGKGWQPNDPNTGSYE